MKKSFLFLVIMWLSLASYAQESNDYGLFFGGSFEHANTILPEVYQTKLGTSSLAPVFGAFYRKNFNTRYSLRVGANYGIKPIYYSDLYLRDLNNILPVTTQPPISKEDLAVAAIETALLPLDIHALVEFNFLPLNPRLEDPKVTTFVAAGLGVYQLRPVLPFIVGVKYRVTEQIGLALEWNLRRRLMGYRQYDNVPYPLPYSEPPVPESKWFSYIGITAYYNVIKTCKTCPFYQSNRK